MAYAFIMTPEIEQEIAAAVVKARANVIPWETLKPTAADTPTDMLKLAERPPAFRPQSIHVDIPQGYRAAISFEEQPAGIFRHLSVSTPRKGQKHLPHPMVVAECCKLFGFADDIVRVLRGERPPDAMWTGRIWTEEFDPDHYAVNVIELETSREVGHA